MVTIIREERCSEILVKFRNRKFFIFGAKSFADYFYRYCRLNHLEDNLVSFVLSDMSLNSRPLNIKHDRPINDIHWLAEHPEINTGFLGVPEDIIESEIKPFFEKYNIDVELYHVSDKTIKEINDIMYCNLFDSLVLSGYELKRNKFEPSNFNLKWKDNIYKYFLRVYQGVDDTKRLFFSDVSIDERYNQQLGSYEYARDKNFAEKSGKKCTIYMAKSHVDRPLSSDFNTPCTKIIQVGAALTDADISEIKDNTGDNISLRNRDYCELTAVYWAWKNDTESDYIGICHYRRRYVINEETLQYFMRNNYDAIYTLPKITEEGIREEFVERNYFLLPETWDYATKAIDKLFPEYSESWKAVEKSDFLIPFNMCIMTRETFNDYCSKLFSILKEVDDNYLKKGIQRNDRYLGYIAEIFNTVYAMKNKDVLKKCYVDMIELKTRES